MNVSIGWASKIGWAVSAAAAALCVSQSIGDSQALLSGTNKPAGIAALIAVVLTNLGRQLQARPLGTPVSTAQLPDALAELAAQAQANVAKVQASPDGTDSAQVPYSGAETLPPAQQG